MYNDVKLPIRISWSYVKNIFEHWNKNRPSEYKNLNVLTILTKARPSEYRKAQILRKLIKHIQKNIISLLFTS